MSFSLTNLPQGNTKTVNCEECFELLGLILDNEATDEQKRQIEHHLSECTTCFDHLHISQSIKQLIKDRIAHKPVPSDLIDSIKLKVSRA